MITVTNKTNAFVKVLSITVGKYNNNFKTVGRVSTYTSCHDTSSAGVIIFQWSDSGSCDQRLAYLQKGHTLRASTESVQTLQSFASLLLLRPSERGGEKKIVSLRAVAAQNAQAIKVISAYLPKIIRKQK